MLYKTQGIVLRTIKYGESSVICKIYTREFGLKSYLVNSVRSSRAKHKQGMLQPISLLDLVVYNKDQKNLQRISEMKRSFLFKELPFNIVKSSIGIFLTEVLCHALPEEDPNERLFDFIHNSICQLDSQVQNLQDFHLIFMLALSRHLGFYPYGKYEQKTPYFDLMAGRFVKNTPDHIHYLEPGLSKHFSALLRDEPVLKRKTRKELLARLVEYYRLHLENFKEIKSPKVLEEVLG